MDGGDDATQVLDNPRVTALEAWPLTRWLSAEGMPTARIAVNSRSSLHQLAKAVAALRAAPRDGPSARYRNS